MDNIHYASSLGQIDLMFDFSVVSLNTDAYNIDMFLVLPDVECVHKAMWDPVKSPILAN
jgi:hypothetical protein